MAGYRYRPLNTDLKEIRLLYFEPSSHLAPEAPVRCRIEHESLSDPHNHNYVAISYTWGTNPNGKIVLDGELVKVQETAETALRGTFSRSLD
jgi:hypothetical protein